MLSSISYFILFSTRSRIHQGHYAKIWLITVRPELATFLERGVWRVQSWGEEEVMRGQAFSLVWDANNELWLLLLLKW